MNIFKKKGNFENQKFQKIRNKEKNLENQKQGKIVFIELFNAFQTISDKLSLNAPR